MDGRVNPHRRLVGVFVGDLMVHVKQVAVPFAHLVFTESFDRITEIEIDAVTARANAPAFIAHLFCGAGGDVARDEIAKGGIPAFEIIIALAFRNPSRCALVIFGLRHPDAAVVAKRLAHQRQLRLVIAADRNAGRVNLRKTRIGEQRAFAMGAPDGGGV